jgi:hypothetical protein
LAVKIIIVKKSAEMHELFANILAKRDLSRAGELFSIEDDEIVDCLTDVVITLCLFLFLNADVNYEMLIHFSF